MSYFDDDPDSAELLMRDFDDDMFMDTTENNDLRGNWFFSTSEFRKAISLRYVKELFFVKFLSDHHGEVPHHVGLHPNVPDLGHLGGCLLQ